MKLWAKCNVSSLSSVRLSCLRWRPGLSDPSSSCKHHRPRGGHGLLPRTPHSGRHWGGHSQTRGPPHEEQVQTQKDLSQNYECKPKVKILNTPEPPHPWDYNISNKCPKLSYPSNREAARECRRKKKEYVKCLENRVAVLENQNKTLIEELKALKDLYCHKSE